MHTRQAAGAQADAAHADASQAEAAHAEAEQSEAAHAEAEQAEAAQAEAEQAEAEQAEAAQALAAQAAAAHAAAARRAARRSERVWRRFVVVDVESNERLAEYPLGPHGASAKAGAPAVAAARPPATINILARFNF